MFVFKGRNSNNMGVYAKEENFLGKASVNYEAIEIDGKDGADLIEYNYQNYGGALSDVVLMKNNRDEVMNWLSGKGKLEYLGKETTIHFLDSYQVKQHNLPTSIPFIRDPFWYKANDEYVTVTNEVVNEGTVYAKPLIKLTKGAVDNVEIRINGVQFEYNFNGETDVVIDCVEMNAYHDNLLRNRQLTIGFEFPVLKVGINTVETLSGDATIEMKRKDVWL